MGDYWPDWSVLSAYLATQTSRIRILTDLVIPYRPVFPTAKQIATIDALSRGRFTLAAAVGWLRPEFEMLGVDYEQRGAITDEYLRAMKVRGPRPSPPSPAGTSGSSDIVFEAEVRGQRPCPGSGSRVAADAARSSACSSWATAGWSMGGDTGNELRDTIARIKEQAAGRGRDPEGDHVPVHDRRRQGQRLRSRASAGRSPVGDPAALGADGSPEAVAGEIARFEAAGFNELAINFSVSPPPRSWSSWTGSALRSCRSCETRAGDIRDDEGIDPAELARLAEARGFESLWFPEHTHIPATRATPCPAAAICRRVPAHLRPLRRVDGRRGASTEPSCSARASA